MMESNNEEEIRNLVKSAYSPASPPPELKKRLLEQLSLEVSGTGISRPLWEQPRILVPILAAIISGLIGYGAWLSLNVVPTLLP
ncbi:MAG: hypothetical protein P8X92_05345 [Dehalococcoidia bacterium]|jgi:hypothetical protein